MSIFNPLNMDLNLDGKVDYMDDIMFMNPGGNTEDNNSYYEKYAEFEKEYNEDFDDENTGDDEYENYEPVYTEEQRPYENVVSYKNIPTKSYQEVEVNYFTDDEHYKTSVDIGQNPSKYNIDIHNINDENYMVKFLLDSNKFSSYFTEQDVTTKMDDIVQLVLQSLIFNFANNCGVTDVNKANLYSYMYKHYCNINNFDAVNNYYCFANEQDNKTLLVHYPIDILLSIKDDIEMRDLDCDVMDIFGDIFSLSMSLENELVETFPGYGFNGLSFKYAGYVYDELLKLDDNAI